MTSRLVIECGVAETRAAFIEDSQVARFWFGPARGDEERDMAPRAGRCFAGRVKSINHSLNAAFVDIGHGLDAFLQLNKNIEPYITEGALIGVSVKSPPRQGKGAVLKYLDAVLDQDAPGRLPPFQDAAVEAVAAIGAGADAISIDNGQASAVLKASGYSADISYEQHAVALFEVYEAESALEVAFDRRVYLNGGGELIIDEAQALTAVDVDTAGLTSSSPARLREKIAIAAAHEAAHQISLRNIGGHVVIDFPSINSKTARVRFNEHLKKAMMKIDGAGGFGFSKSGLFCFTAPHHAQSLLERFTEISPGRPVSGRRFTIDFQVKSAIRNLEHRLRAAPRAVLRIRLGSVLNGYIKIRRNWRDRLRERYGARFEIVADDGIKERAYELSE
jgi:Ribonuclease G/E